MAAELIEVEDWNRIAHDACSFEITGRHRWICFCGWRTVPYDRVNKWSMGTPQLQLEHHWKEHGGAKKHYADYCYGVTDANAAAANS